MKRGLDILVSAALLTALAPAFAVIALLVRWHLGAPVLFKQQRPGRHERPFGMLKFRTLTNRRGPDGMLLPDAQRMTPFGRLLRSTSLDELPGLINVLKGEMSLVGPRPLLVQYLPLYDDFQRRRHEVRPGITGWAQVNGRNALSWDEKFAHDVWYVDNHSFLLDLRILLMTARKVILRDGITAEGEATMSAFTGGPRPSGAAGAEPSAKFE